RSFAQTPSLEVRTHSSAPTSDERVTIVARNIPRVHVRLYPTTLKELLKNESSPGEWNSLRQIPVQTLNHLLEGRASFEGVVDLTPPKPYEAVEKNAGLPPALPVGLYAVVVSTDPDF